MIVRRCFNAIGVYGTALVGLAAVTTLDIVTGYEVSFSLFYLLPILLMAWKRGSRSTLLMAGLSAAAWMVAERMSGREYSHSLIPFWNSVVRLTFFLAIGGMFQGMRETLRRERSLARTDSLTGAVNRRYFFEKLADELERAHRYDRPFAVAYLDLDHFKKVNDEMGHQAGDEVLKTVVRVMTQSLRRSDTVARLGGDEFALLLPETAPAAAELVVVKLRYLLLDAMRAEGWPVTMSIGLLNCGGARLSGDELVKRVDQLMYAVKRDGRDNVRIANAA